MESRRCEFQVQLPNQLQLKVLVRGSHYFGLIREPSLPWRFRCYRRARHYEPVVTGNTIQRADVVFNPNYSWNVYNGGFPSGRTIYDFRRVAIHEFGHLLGLHHPDERGQFRRAVMHSAYQEHIDELQTDDINGIRAIYGSARTDGPDLVVESARVNDTTLRPGQRFTLTATVRNRGNAATRFTASLEPFRSNDSHIDTSDSALGITHPLAPLSPGASVTETINLSAPAAGTHYYGACVYVAGEANDNNNCSNGVRVTVSGRGGSPDLLVQSPPQVSDSAVSPGQRFTVTVVVRNVGRAMPELSLPILQYYRSTNPVISRRDTPERNPQVVRSLGAGASTTESIQLTAPSTTGIYYYGACVSAVGDTFTDNDCSSPGARVDVREGCTVNLGSLTGERHIDGRWTTSCSTTRLGDRYHYKDYRFSLSRRGRVVAYLSSSRGPTMSLRDGSGRTVASAFPRSGESLVSFSANVSAGAYRLRTVPDAARATGSFTLSIGVSAGTGFRDDPVVVGRTIVRAGHITELRGRIDAVRRRYGLRAYVWTDPTIRSGRTRISAVHVVQLRSALNAAYDAARRTRPTYTGGVRSGGRIRAAHINELRRAVLALE